MNVAKSDLLKWLALAEAAYTPTLPAGFEQLGRITADPARAHALIDPADLDFGFVAREIATGDIHVWFRGTRDIAEWIDDATAVLIPHPECGMVHAGFYGLFEALIDSVAAVVPIGSPCIIFGGHSLGAGPATYAAVSRWIGREIVTFEGPRPGDVDFAEYVEVHTIRHLRIVNYADIVPHLPPRPWFSHAGGFIGFSRCSTDLRAAHSLSLSVGPAVAEMAAMVVTATNQR